MEQAVVKILLLGICGYGSNYIKEISERDIPGIKIEGICEVVPNAADLYPIIKEQNIPIYQTPEDFYKEHTADLAVVSTPIHLHYSQIVTCLTHGSNVLTEKPVCTSVEGARKLEQLEKETGKFISVGYQLMFLRDGEIPANNSASERTIRPFTVGRKNWMMLNTPRGHNPVQFYTALQKQPRPIS